MEYKPRWRVDGRDVQSRMDHFRSLLVTTDLPISECRQVANVYNCAEYREIISESRKRIGRGRWLNLKTGEVRPPNVCTSFCAAEKTGLSRKTITRRIKEGLIDPVDYAGHRQGYNFSPLDIFTLKRFGRKVRTHGNAVVTVADVPAIRRMAKFMFHRDIGYIYGVSRRQISRIVTGERWGSVPTDPVDPAQTLSEPSDSPASSLRS